MTFAYLPVDFKFVALSTGKLQFSAFDSGQPRQEFAQAFAFISALTQQDANTAIIDIRLIHDQRKDLAAIPRRGRLFDIWPEIIAWQALGYGCFVAINAMDGIGREIANVTTIRCQAIDLDNLSAQQNYERATQFNPAPSFAVQSSPGRWHVYWITTPHNDRDKFTLLQRKLRAVFDSDRTIIDPSRVLRLPGTLHLKEKPHLITCWSLAGYGMPIDPGFLEIALAGVNVIDGSGGRHPLGEPSLSAPSKQWASEALRHADPNAMDRGEWISFSSAWKQAAWLHGDPDGIRDEWLQWCAQYTIGNGNDVAENLKAWASVRNTEIGWNSLLNKLPSLKASFHLGRPAQQSPNTPPMPHEQQQSIPVPTGEILTDSEQREWFKGCYFVTSRGQILTRDGFMNATQFNGAYGGKKFIVDSVGKSTDEPWKAATRSTLWQIQKVHHTRFLPTRPHGELIIDALGRLGINTYKPASIDARPGDISPFLNHLCAMIPDENDRNIILDYCAHNIKFPGFKIPWAPLIQSTEGIGKNLFKLIMQHGLGENYVHQPKTKELLESGTKFNAWMREKLFIIADEIKTDDKRDLVETLKPIISEERSEIQGKGADQAMEDNFANWLFFSNHKDAIPISKNGRRYAVFFSALQSLDDLIRRGMNDSYFKHLFDWIKADGAAYVVYWLQQRAIERGAIPMRAPDTTSKPEALQEGQNDIAKTIQRMIDDEQNGFRHGWANSVAVERDWTKYRPGRTTPRQQDIGKAIADLGYRKVDRAGRAYFQDHPEKRAVLWFKGDRNVKPSDYPVDQGYGDPTHQPSNVVPFRPTNG
ncbi:DUF5906 domain-containing protein [Nitrobacter winogradskyi]|uniref:Uncharacterized protein n=2 Tax=Nitrobacter winogradskyi TaxID=913 RepID=A0ACC6ADQ8_NITWI|nr:DUF5906 domain-containing protein [Nitrobacter winogradskyi]MCP1997879.1 hypothetical protein [Nitrobacter winogradskyi]GEC17539.1 hypothetical protein NWI01_34310 [Nitrobacter winogradskyi]